MDKKTKNIIIAVVIIAVCVAFYFAYTNYKTTAQEQGTSQTTEATDFKVYDQNNNLVSLSDFKGKPVVINFAASWCGYCVEEMPSFQKAYDNYKDDVVFLIVAAIGSRGETPKDFDGMIEDGGYTFTYYYDNDQNAVAAFSVTSFPQTYYVNKDGNIANVHYGALNYEMLEEGIKAIL